MVRLAQTLHLSCVKISTISKQTKSSFHLSLVTLEYHQVCPKWLLSLWYVWRKPCSNLVSTLALSPNGPKQNSIRPTSPRSSIGCVQNDFLSLQHVRHKPEIHVASRFALSPNRMNQASTWALSPRSTIAGVQNDFEPMVRLAQTVELSCAKTNTISKRTKTRFHMTHVT
jgi:hypothetical protein